MEIIQYMQKLQEMIGKVYSEKLWVSRKYEKRCSSKTYENKYICRKQYNNIKKKTNPEYVIRTDTYKFRRNTL